MQRLTSVDDVFELLESGGGEAYFGEPVTVLEHSLQAAWFVHRGGGESTLIAAALLHDLGHLLHSEGEDATRRGLDTQHEELAAAALGDHLPASVLDPIRLHVAAKRYLCYAEPGYMSALSPASQQSLALQGGPMNDEQAAAFLRNPYANAAIALRRWDDEAKVVGLHVPNAAYYLPMLRTAAAEKQTGK